MICLQYVHCTQKQRKESTQEIVIHSLRLSIGELITWPQTSNWTTIRGWTCRHDDNMIMDRSKWASWRWQHKLFVVLSPVTNNKSHPCVGYSELPYLCGAEGLPDLWKWIFCHLPSFRCQTRVSSACVVMGKPVLQNVKIRGIKYTFCHNI